MKRTLLIAVAAAGLIGPMTLAAPAFATNGGGHAGRGMTTVRSCTDPDREATTYVPLPAWSMPGGGGQTGTIPANGLFDFCSNTATPTSNGLWVYGEYSSGGHFYRGWEDENRLKGIHVVH